MRIEGFQTETLFDIFNEVETLRKKVGSTLDPGLRDVVIEADNRIPALSSTASGASGQTVNGVNYKVSSQTNTATSWFLFDGTAYNAVNRWNPTTPYPQSLQIRLNTDISVRGFSLGYPFDSSTSFYTTYVLQGSGNGGDWTNIQSGPINETGRTFFPRFSNGSRIDYLLSADTLGYSYFRLLLTGSIPLNTTPPLAELRLFTPLNPYQIDINTQRFSLARDYLLCRDAYTKLTSFLTPNEKGSVVVVPTAPPGLPTATLATLATLATPEACMRSIIAMFETKYPEWIAKWSVLGAFTAPVVPTLPTTTASDSYATIKTRLRDYITSTTSLLQSVVSQIVELLRTYIQVNLDLGDGPYPTDDATKDRNYLTHVLNLWKSGVVKPVMLPVFASSSSDLNYSDPGTPNNGTFNVRASTGPNPQRAFDAVSSSSTNWIVGTLPKAAVNQFMGLLMPMQRAIDGFSIAYGSSNFYTQFALEGANIYDAGNANDISVSNPSTTTWVSLGMMSFGARGSSPVVGGTGEDVYPYNTVTGCFNAYRFRFVTCNSLTPPAISHVNFYESTRILMVVDVIYQKYLAKAASGGAKKALTYVYVDTHLKYRRYLMDSDMQRIVTGTTTLGALLATAETYINTDGTMKAAFTTLAGGVTYLGIQQQMEAGFRIYVDCLLSRLSTLFATWSSYGMSVPAAPADFATYVSSGIATAQVNVSALTTPLVSADAAVVTVASIRDNLCVAYWPSMVSAMQNFMTPRLTQLNHLYTWASELTTKSISQNALGTHAATVGLSTSVQPLVYTQPVVTATGATRTFYGIILNIGIETTRVTLTGFEWRVVADPPTAWTGVPTFVAVSAFSQAYTFPSPTPTAGTQIQVRTYASNTVTNPAITYATAGTNIAYGNIITFTY